MAAAHDFLGLSLRRIAWSLASLCLITLGVIFGGPVFADNPASGSEIPNCQPAPKLLHYEVVEDNRESRIAHRGQVRLSFTIGSKGEVRDVRILDSSDDWFDDVSTQTVLKLRYRPPTHVCRNTMTLRFRLQN
jgi:TonB family protein